MPEASIHKNSDTCLRKNDVCASTHSGEGCYIDSIAETHLVKN